MAGKSRDIRIDLNFVTSDKPSPQSLSEALAEMICPELFQAADEAKEALAEARGIIRTAIPGSESVDQIRLQRIAELEAELATLKRNKSDAA